jgi:hypothetical protein
MDEPGAMSGASLGQRKTIAMPHSKGSTKHGDAEGWGYKRSSLPPSPFGLTRQSQSMIRPLADGDSPSPESVIRKAPG